MTKTSGSGVVLTHPRPDGDAVGAAFAMALLGGWGVHLFGSLPKWFETAVARIGAPPFQVDAPVPSGVPLVVVDCGLDRVHDHLPTGHGEVVVHLDHHQGTMPGGVWSVIDTQASSACEIVTAHTPVGEITPAIATWLLLGMRTDTLGFKTSSVSADTLALAGRLLSCGADLALLNDLLDRGVERRRMQVCAQLVAQPVHDDPYVMAAPLDLTEGLSKQDLGTVFSLTERIDDLDLVVLLIEQDHQVLAEFRSVSEGSARALALALGGGGHPKAAGATLALPLQAASEAVMAAWAAMTA